MNQPIEKSWMEEVGLSSEIGGPDFPFLRVIVSLSQHLRKYCCNSYSPEVKGFVIVARVEASLKSYGPECIDRVRRNKKNHYIAADVVIPVSRWKNQSEKAFSAYLASRVGDALRICIRKLKEHKIEVDEMQLLIDFGEAEARFLSKYD